MNLMDPLGLMRFFHARFLYTLAAGWTFDLSARLAFLIFLSASCYVVKDCIFLLFLCPILLTQFSLPYFCFKVNIYLRYLNVGAAFSIIFQGEAEGDCLVGSN